MTAAFTENAMTTIEAAAREVLAACSEGDALRANLAVLRRLTRLGAGREPVTSIALRRKIAARVLEAGGFSAA